MLLKFSFNIQIGIQCCKTEPSVIRTSEMLKLEPRVDVSCMVITDHHAIELSLL